MTLQIRPIGAKVIANTSGNKTSLSGAKNVYIMGTAADTITLSNGGTFQIAANSPIVVKKVSTETIYSGANTTHMTPIDYPR